MPRGFEFVDSKWTLIPVIPAEAGIQAVFELEPKTNLDAGRRRHDEPSLLLKHALRRLEGVRDFNHARE